MPNKKDLVQTKNPKSGHYVKIDRNEGKIMEMFSQSQFYTDRRPVLL